MAGRGILVLCSDVLGWGKMDRRALWNHLLTFGDPLYFIWQISEDLVHAYGTNFPNNESLERLTQKPRYQFGDSRVNTPIVGRVGLVR